MAIPKGYIKQLRDFRKVPAYIGRIVTYAGHPYRIASAKAGGLVLRSELLVHPQDDNIDYNPPANINQQSQQGEIERLRSLIEKLVSDKHMVEVFDNETDTMYCAYCTRTVVEYDEEGGAVDLPHATDCLWIAARQMVGLTD